MGSPTVTAAPAQFKGAKIRASSGGAIPNSVSTLVPFDVADFDTDGFWDGANPERLTVPVGIKKARLTVNFVLSNLMTTECKYYVYLNGSNTYNGRLSAQSMDSGAFSGSVVMDVSEGDYLEFYILQVSGSTQYIASSRETWMSIEKVE